MTNTTITLTSIASTSTPTATPNNPELDSLSCLYEELSHESSYEGGRWDGNEAVFIIDDTASNVVPW